MQLGRIPNLAEVAGLPTSLHAQIGHAAEKTTIVDLAHALSAMQKNVETADQTTG
ncbi:MAG: hypothetical protein GKR96_00120 [Gammaproteobacteria bacterium]|nr:hypothetical protein [Gammaproteobacteria bacterium]